MRLKQSVGRGISIAFLPISKTFDLWKGFRIFLYHSVGSRLPHDFYGISIDAALFERHMALLAGKSDTLSVVALDEYADSDTSSHIGITFDDGYKDNLATAAPTLLRYKIPFTVFVTTSFVHGASSIYLSRDDLKELSSLPGVTIGSHGMTHASLTDCDEPALWEELYGSKCYLEDLLGKPVYALSYPHGMADGRVRNAAVRAGYTLGACSHCGVNTPGRDTMFLRRTEVLASDSESIFSEKIYGAWDWYGWVQADPASR